MPDNYLAAIWEHTQECQENLDMLAKIATERHLTRLEQLASERVLQILIEACIGVAKYWLKIAYKQIPTDAYASFAKLATMQQISTKDLAQWRKIIGMRNALVHDYLTIDTELLHAVLVQQAYKFLINFISCAKQSLNRG